MSTKEKTRFDTRLAKDQKELFQYAADLGGFKTLSEFIIFSAQEKAKIIINEHNTILASKRDQKIFFDALLNPSLPNQKLKEAALSYKMISKK
jgi:uncharacterized protein (DUF1778 family)